MPEQTPDLRTLMQNPYFLMGARMMGANQGKGMAAGPAAGQAAVGAAGDLQRVETASANRTWRNKQSAIQEERNRIMQDMNMKRMELAQKQYESEKDLANQPLTWVPPDPKTGAPGVYTMGGRPVPPRYEDPMAQLMRSMNEPDPTVPPGTGTPDPYATAATKWRPPAATPSPAGPPPVNRNVPGMPAPMVQGAPGVAPGKASARVPGLTPGDLTPEQLRALRLMQLQGGGDPQLIPTPAQLP